MRYLNFYTDNFILSPVVPENHASVVEFYQQYSRN